jgi:hypothetical protein
LNLFDQVQNWLKGTAGGTNQAGGDVKLEGGAGNGSGDGGDVILKQGTPGAGGFDGEIILSNSLETKKIRFNLDSLTSSRTLTFPDSGGTFALGDQIPDVNGWIPMTDTWTRTGNFTFTVSGNVTATYRKGAKVRYKDGGPFEYGVIGSSSYSSPNTTITLITNANYAMAAATITDKYLSYVENPEGFPRYFDYTPSYSASGSMTYTSVSTITATWTAKAQTIFVRVLADGTTGGTASVTLFASAPITEASNSTNIVQPGSYAEGGAGLLGFSFVSSGLIGSRKADSSNYGLGAGRTLNANVNYEF